MRLFNKTAAITGAGGGIGRRAALSFAEEGAFVYILEIDEKSGQATERDILKMGGRAAFIHTDVSDRAGVKNAFGRVEAERGALDILYNNASVFWRNRDGILGSLDLDDFEKILGINLKGTAYCCHYAIPLIKKAGGGSIINTGSSAGVIGIPGCDAYTAAKGAVVSLTRSLAVEYGPFNIRTNCICPAAIYTPMVAESNLSDPHFDEKRFLEQGTPLRRWGKPEEIASVALFLATDGAAYLNGAIIVADGGITIM